MSASVSEPLPQGSSDLPRAFGRYVLFDQIGRGGMADILLARADTAFGGSRLCVVKQMLPQLARDPQFERMLVAEAKLAARLTHANIVQVFDLGREGGRLYIGMEYVEGFDLNQLLRALSKAKIALPAEFAVFVLLEVLRALDYAHRARDDEGNLLGIVHRDVSPSNVLISFEGEVKLCDFGIARAFAAPSDGESAVESAGSVAARAGAKLAGKAAYMSPEHARGEALDARADVFAAGIILWELCAGRRLYRGSEAAVFEQAKKAEVPALPDRGLPEHSMLQALVARAVAPAREDRFQSAADFLLALEDYAIEAKLMVSQLKLGSFLTDHFAQQIVEMRRARELAARELVSEHPPGPVEPSPPAASSLPVVEEMAELAGDQTVEEGFAVGREHGFREHGWNEPGTPLSQLRAVARPGEGPREAEPLSGEFSEVELDRSLLGLELLAAEAPLQPTPDHPLVAFAELAAPRESRDWVWYVAAVGILALGVVGYFWR